MSNDDVTGAAHTPFILPAEHPCILCLACTQVCPSGALEPLIKMEEVNIGLAKVDKHLCVAHSQTGVCGVCHTACPLKNKAITIDYPTRPTVIADGYSGCGQREEVCPAKGTKAISIFPLEERLS